MVLEGECPPEEEEPPAAPPGAPAPAPIVRVVRVPVPAPPAAFPALDALLDLLRAIRDAIRGTVYVYTRPAKRVEVKHLLLTDTVNFTNLATIPEDALQWELWNSTLGTATGTLQWAYVVNPGVAGTGQFNQIASDQRVSRALAGETIYVRPQTANQVVVLEVLRP